MNAGLTIDPVQRLHRTVGQDRAEAFIDAVKNPLGLAEGIAEQHAGSAGGDVCAPPLVDLVEDLRLGLPAVDGQAEGRFGDEGMAFHRLERGAGAVRLDFVIPDATQTSPWYSSRTWAEPSTWPAG